MGGQLHSPVDQFRTAGGDAEFYKFVDMQGLSIGLGSLAEPHAGGCRKTMHNTEETLTDERDQVRR